MARLQAELDAFRRSSAEALRVQQNERLAVLLKHHYTNPYNDSYRALLKSHGIEDESELPRSVGELRRLPTISRRFLEEADYAQRPGVPPDQVRKIIETSGTAGSPLRIPHTYETVRRCYAEMFVRTALLAGVPVTEPSYWVMHWVPGGKDDWASHESSLAFSELPDVGAALIVSTHTTPPEHWENLRKHRPVLGASAPNFFLAFASYAEGQGLDLATSSLRNLLLGGASCLPEDRGFLERTYGLERLSMFYASSESFFCAGELPNGAGYLCYADEFLVEVIDYDGDQVAPGERGRVAITNLGNHGFPAIRYLQGDAAVYLGESSTYPGFGIIDEIQRVDAGELGDGQLTYSEIEMMPRRLLALGIPARALQIARRRDGLTDVPVFRIETPIEDRARIEAAVLEVFTRNLQMRDMLDGGLIHPPIVELYAPGSLSRGRLKIPVYVDERTGSPPMRSEGVL